MRYAFGIPYAYAVSEGIKTIEELEAAVRAEKEVNEQNI